MKRWAGPLAGLVVFVALARWLPGPDACVVGPDAAPASAPGRGALSDPKLSITAIRPSAVAAAPDPFGLAETAPTARPSATAPRAASGPAPSRPWKVTGLVGVRAAVLVRPDGASLVVSVGQRVDSATVVGISPAGVEIEDRRGRFLLKVR